MRYNGMKKKSLASVLFFTGIFRACVGTGRPGELPGFYNLRLRFYAIYFILNSQLCKNSRK
ncbi:MAG: hypothetical protein BGP14_08605 [Sphingobacteriales bacterium 44-15]|nr:MAG: hypothetical protein BGP14_08605 [Sphingobacteriales bacterium 44-15]